MHIPENLKYTSDHEWVMIESDRAKSESPITPKMHLEMSFSLIFLRLESELPLAKL